MILHRLATDVPFIACVINSPSVWIRIVMIYRLKNITYYLDSSNFILDSGLSLFGVLTICLLLVYFGSAAGCHCFDLQKSEFLKGRQGWIRILHKDGVPDQVRALSQVGTKKISKGGWAILELLSHVGTIT